MIGQPQTTDATGDGGGCANTRNAHAAVVGVPSATAPEQATDIDTAKQRIEDAAQGVRAQSETTDFEADFFSRIKTPEIAQKVARRLGKPHGVFADFAVRWGDAIAALEQELQNGCVQYDRSLRRDRGQH